MKNKENVWDYPRPPRLEKCSHILRVIFNNTVIADTNRGYRILETSHPPTYYIPLEDCINQYLIPSNRTSYCEFKGKALYYSIKIEEKVSRDAAWYYPEPNINYAEIKNHISFYANKVDACFVDEEKVIAQEGDFYGGWITQNIEGPFKGAVGTEGW
ncbi:MAG: DUF427 domain-containing protein [Chlamydiales bacterium]